MKYICIILYYCFLFYLPSPYIPYIGKCFSKLRARCLHFINPKIHSSSTIGRKCHIGNCSNLVIANHSSLGDNFKMNNAIVEIGEYVMIASDVTIMGGGHRFDDVTIPMLKQGEIGKTQVKIESDVWIGTRVTILAKNITIGKGSIIGAGSVITKDVPEYAIVAGNPAHIIRMR